MVALSLVACVFLQLAYAIHESRLTRAEMLVAKLEQRSPATAEAWSALLAGVGIVMFALIAAGMWPDFVRAVATSEFAGVARGRARVPGAAPCEQPPGEPVGERGRCGAVAYRRSRGSCSRRRAVRGVVDDGGGAARDRRVHDRRRARIDRARHVDRDGFVSRRVFGVSAAPARFHGGHANA